MTDIANTYAQKIDWRNEHGTARQKGVTRYLPIASTGDALARFRRVGDVVKDVVGHAFARNEPLRADGSRWSLSRIGVPTRLALSLAAHDVLDGLPGSWLSPAYANSLTAAGHTPLLVSGSMKIRRINDVLAMRDLALQTSGASDGQTLAGATATGTHGGAVSVGAMHDTVRAVHLMVAPNQTLLVQSSSAPLTGDAASALQEWFGIPTRLVSDDALFHAAQVHLGSLGLVLNMVVEAEPLYHFTSVTTPHAGFGWKSVLSAVDPAVLASHPGSADVIELILNPYAPNPKTGTRAWVTSMTKTRFQHQAGVETRPDHPTRPSPELIGLLSSLAQLADLGLTNPIFRKRITAELSDRYGKKKITRRALPGVMYGPTALPKGQGHSTEFVVNAGNALLAVESVQAALAAELSHGRQYLGGIGVRFVGGSAATLAPNRHAPSCFIELPTIRTQESTKIFKACSKALDAAGVAHGCHWGQYLVSPKRRLRSYWGPAATAAWITAREQLLPTAKARKVFASPILKGAGLG